MLIYLSFAVSNTLLAVVSKCFSIVLQLFFLFLVHPLLEYLSLLFHIHHFLNSFACSGCIIFLRTTLLGSGSFLTGIPLQL